MKKGYNVIVSGVGGQGIILASELLSLAAMEAGYDVKKSEVHGMSQRGGDVVSHVRFSEKVYSPLIEQGTCDVILAFEKAEALRYLHYLKPKDGIVIMNNLEIIPLPVTAGEDTYPENIENTIKKYANLVVVDAIDMANNLGNPRVANTIMLGVASKFFDISEDVWIRVITNRVPKKTIEINKKAFELGRNLKIDF